MNALYNSLANKLERYLRIDAKYFLSGGFWLSAGQIMTALTGLLTTVLFAHYLTESDYGVYKYLIGIAVLLSSLSLTGLGQSILLTAAKKQFGFYQSAQKINFYYTLPIIIMSLGTSAYYFVNENTLLAAGCLLIAIIQPLISTFQFIPPFLQGSSRYKETTFLNITRSIFIASISISALIITKNIFWLFMVYLLSNLAINVLSHFYFRPADKKIENKIYIKYIQFAKHTSFRNIITNVSNRVDTVVIFTQLGAVELAIYTIATAIPEQMKGSIKNLMSLLLPKFSQYSDINQLKKIASKRTLQIFVGLLLITFVYILIAPTLYGIMFPKYPDAIIYSQIAALALPTFILYLPYNILQTQLQESALYKITFYSSFFQIITLLVFVLSFGLIGAIISKLLYRMSLVGITYWYLHKQK